MKKLIVILFLLLLLPVAVVFAATVASADSYVSTFTGQTGTNFNGNNLQVAASNVSTCNASNTTYMKFDLSAVNGEVSNDTTNSNLTLTVNFVQSGSTGTLTLYRLPEVVPPADEDAWIETTITNDNAPAPGAEVATVAVPTGVGTVTFIDPRLNAYLNEQSAYVGGGDTNAGDNVASFVLRITGCSGNLNAVRFNAREVTNGPTLNLFNPTAVHIANISTGDGNGVSPFIWLAIALPLFVVVAVLVMRRRGQIA